MSTAAEALQARHRKELRDLQSRVTGLRKQASKKTRKGVNDECARLEAELRARQAAELVEVAGDGGEEIDEKGVIVEDRDERDTGAEDGSVPAVESVTGRVEDLSLRESDGPAPLLPPPPPSEPPAPGKKRNRARDRLARRAEEQEQLARQAAVEASELPDMKAQERERMQEAMTARGLQEREIRADGHCLYSAVADQLVQLGIPLGASPGDGAAVLPYKVVRAAAAAYIERNGDDFAPFLEEPLPEHVHKVRDTAEWGGQLELMALAKTYETDINVLQDFGRVEKIEAGGQTATDRQVWLGYYKHGFGLGEHYNSLRKKP